MPRKLVTQQKTVIEEVGRSTNVVGEYTTCEQLDVVRYEWSWSNGSSLGAVISFEVADDLNGTWSTLDTGTFSLSGASGLNDLYILQVVFKYVRPRITFSAGSADLTVKVKAKTIAA